MTINIKATNIELTSTLTDYVNKKLSSVDKFISEGSDVNVYVEIGKTTNHHKQGEHYKAEFDVTIDGEKFFTVAEKSNLHMAIDDARNQLLRKIKNNRNKKNTLFKRGAISIKKMIRGVSKRNPFTSKY